MKVAIGSDHSVFGIKEEIVKFLQDRNYEVINVGTFSDERTHYPIYGKKVGEEVVSGRADLGVVICGSGIGITNSANKVDGIKACLASDIHIAKKAKKDFNCNVIGVGGRVIGIELMKDIIISFLETV